MQELITKELEESAPGLYETDGRRDKVAVAHLFAVWAGWDWYVVEYETRRPASPSAS